jgi:hypothetical protein
MGWKDLLGLTPTPKDLAQTLIQRAPAPMDGHWHYEPEQNQIRGDHGVTINLANIYNEYVRAQRTARPALLEKYLALMLPREPKLPKLWSLARQQLYVVVRSRYDHAIAAISGQLRDPQFSAPLQAPWIGDLCLRLVYDLGPSVMLVPRRYLDDWGQSEDAVREQGLRNLAGLDSPRWEPLAEGVYRLDSSVSYEESLLLVDRVADRVPLRGPGVFIPVNRGVLLACEANAPDSLEWMLDAARHSLMQNPWPMGSTLLHKHNGVWQEFVTDGSAARKVAALKKINIAQVYDAQKSVLQEYCESQHDDVFVATFQLRQGQQDPDDLQSFGTWTEGVATLLPRTDIVAFVRDVETPRQESALVAWEQAVEICGHRMQVGEWDPPRFRVNDFPSAEEWQRLLVLGRHV